MKWCIVTFAGLALIWVWPVKLLAGEYPINNALRHTGYHKKPDADMYLDNNGGLMAMAPYGAALLTDGPGGRGLDFNSDQDFIDTGAIGRYDEHMSLFFGCFNAPVSGNYEFRNAGDDDRCGIWLDLDQDDVFESSLPGLGSNRGEQLSWEDGGTKTVYLDVGSYMFAVTHGEYGGGSRVDVRFKTPAMGGQVIIKPSDPAQAGMWTTVPVPVSEPPVADAGEDIIADANEVVILDANASYDPDGDIVQYTWSALPEDVVLYSGEESSFKTKALGRVEEVIKLTVKDNTGGTSEDTVSILNKRVEEIELTPGPEGPQGPQGEQGPPGQEGEQGPAGITPEEVLLLQEQVSELQEENTILRQQVQELQALLDRISSLTPVRQWLKKEAANTP